MSPFQAPERPCRRCGGIRRLRRWRRLFGPASEVEWDSPPLPDASGLRARIVEVAEREWKNWQEGSLGETSAEATPLLKQYHRVGVRQSRTDAELRSKAWHAGHPWSAVFISYVMREAGAGNAFGYSAAHTGYVAAAKRATRKGDASSFRAFRFDQAALEPGDVVVRDRVNIKTRQCYGSNFENAEKGGHSHGEIVLEVNPQAGYAVTIGGNTSQEYPRRGLAGNTAGKHKIRIDSSGRVVQQGKCKYFAVLKPPSAMAPESEQFTPAEPVPVLELTSIQVNNYTAAFTRKSSGFDAFFCGDLPTPQATISINGRVMMEDLGVRRTATSAELKKWQPKTVVNGVYLTPGMNAATSPVARHRSDGTFTTESLLVLAPGARRLRVQVTVDFKGGRQVTAEAVFQRNDFECFLSLIDSYEKKRPVGAVDGVCQVAFGHFEFLSSVRKMFQPAPGSSLSGMFDQFLYRNRKICRLTKADSAAGRNLRWFEKVEINGEIVDMGHILVGIEAARKQKPDSTLPFVRGDATTELLMTWAGDLGSGLEPYAEAIIAGRNVNLAQYLKDKAGREDLLGDIDGLNIGAVYDETKSLAANLLAYYNAKPFQRFNLFLSRMLDEMGRPFFRLATRNPPKLDPASRAQTAHYIEMFVAGVRMKKNVLGPLTNDQAYRLITMTSFGSPEMDATLDYFYKFLEAGLAKE